MRVTLEVKSGMSIGRRFDVNEGAPAIFGRSEAATHTVPHDPLLAEEHFSLAADREGWHLTVLAGGEETLVNGEAAESALLNEGDRISAGRTVFLVTKMDLTPLDASRRRPAPAAEGDGEGAAAAAPAGAAAGAEAGAEAGAAAGAAAGAGAVAPKEETTEVAAAAPQEDPTGPELLEWLDQDEEIQEVAQEGQTAKDLLPVFVMRGDHPVALRLRAHLLEPRSAVWWGCLCLREVFGGEPPPKERIAWHAAKTWVAKPTEEHRRDAEKAGPGAGMKGLCSMLCAAAFWSGGSLAPEGMTAVPPDVRLAGQAVTGLLLMAAPHGDPTKAEERYRRFLELGDEVADGAHPFPEP